MKKKDTLPSKASKDSTGKLSNNPQVNQPGSLDSQKEMVIPIARSPEDTSLNETATKRRESESPKNENKTLITNIAGNASAVKKRPRLLAPSFFAQKK